MATKVEHGVVKAPNNVLRANKAAHVSMTPASGRASFDVPNLHLHNGDVRTNQMPLKKGPAATKAPDHRFAITDAKMPQPKSAVKPGKGLVPIQGIGVNGLPNTSVPILDAPARK
jgi:hypothetical protein